ncbi:MAG TPA: O-methyltransferase [Candidatus Dormibacteraeota bacterium]
MADRSGRGSESGPAISAHMGALFWPEDPVLSEIAADLREHDVPIQVGRDSGRTLQLLVAALPARRVVELGTLAGYSAIWMARGLPAGGRVDTVEVDPARADRAQRWLERAGVAASVRILRGAALDVLPTLEPPYDLAFIDAVKSEYVAYLDHLLRLVRPGGLICADNVHWGGRVADPAVTDADTEGLRAFLRRIAHEPRLLSTVLPTGDGLSVSLVR